MFMTPILFMEGHLNLVVDIGLRGLKKLNKSFSCNFDCLAVIIRHFLTHLMLCDCDIEEYDFILLCILKLLRIETIEWKFLHFFVWETQWVRSQTLSECLSQPSTRSRSAWTVSKVSTDVRAVVERLLWVVTVCEMPFEELLRLRDAIRGTACGMPFEGQQYFDHCLHVCWHLRHRPCTSWSRRRLWETDKVCDLTHFVSAHEEEQKLSLDCLFAELFWNTQQKQTIFIDVTDHRAG